MKAPKRLIEVDEGTAISPLTRGRRSRGCRVQISLPKWRPPRSRRYPKLPSLIVAGGDRSGRGGCLERHCRTVAAHVGDATIQIMAWPVKLEWSVDAPAPGSSQQCACASRSSACTAAVVASFAR